jgi:hypothetical protein
MKRRKKRDIADTGALDGTRDPVEQAGLESFPASDPPNWVRLHPGQPKRNGEVESSSAGARGAEAGKRRPKPRQGG